MLVLSRLDVEMQLCVFVAHWGPGGWDWCSSEQHSAGVVPLKLETLHPWVVALCVQAEDARVPPEILA